MIAHRPAEGNESVTRRLSAPVPVSFDPDTQSDLAHVGETTSPQLGASHSAQCVQTDQLWAFDGSTWTQSPSREQPAEFAAAHDASTHQIVMTGG
jgi:hypothetical protein